MWQPLPRMIMADCGHSTYIEESMTIFGETRRFKLIVKSDGTTMYCHNCLAQMAIQCAWCGRLICVCDPITLYSQNEKRQLSKTATKINSFIVHDIEIYTGCLRNDCADSFLDRTGFWYPPGIVLRVISPKEQMSLTWKDVEIDDICDIDEAIEKSKACLEPYKKYL